MTDMTGGDLYSSVDHIKIIVKQPTAHTEIGINNHQAGTLTNSTVYAMKKICDKVMQDSKLYDRKDKYVGAVYIRTNRETGQINQVT